MSARICVVTGTRAEWGLLSPIARGLKPDERFEVLVLATGTHLSEEYGSTWREIGRDGFRIAERVEIPLEDDTELGMAHSTACALDGIAEALRRLSPDLVLLLGDRYETFAAATAAYVLRIPVAHMHGGELTFGAVDDALRHAITKMSVLHFTSTEEYRRRVIQLGEDPSRVFAVGATGVDNALALDPVPRAQLEDALGVRFLRPTAVVTYHPATMAGEATLEELEGLLAALDEFEDMGVLFTHPNADAHSRAVRERVDAWAATHTERSRSFASLGVRDYFSALRNADLVIGNSSSGVIEAPSFGIPTIDIGDRQAGRVTAESVIHVGGHADEIVEAIGTALSEEFRDIAGRAVNPYGDGHATERVVAVLSGLEFPLSVRKEFHDIEEAAS